MSEFQDRTGYRGKPGLLSEMMREVRIAAADKSDVVIDMKEADRARLDLLAQELKPVIDDIPADNDLFDFAVSSGLQPRFWIDAVSHVQMGRDRRTYRFVRDTRLGRVVMAESTDMRAVAEQVTRYIAERLIERQRLMEGSPEPVKEAPVSAVQLPAPSKTVEGVSASVQESAGTGSFVAGLVWVLLGAVMGGGLLMLYLSGQLGALIKSVTGQ